MKAFILLLSFLSIALPEAHSQRVPGYLGHRLALGYHANLFPALINPVRGTELGGGSDDYRTAESNYSFKLSMQHHLVADYSLNKRWSISGDLMFSTSAFNPFWNYHPSSVSFSEYAKYSAVGALIGAKQYSAHFAPLGSYLEYRVGYTKLNVQDFEYQNISFASDTAVVVKGGSIGVPMLGVGWGVNRVIEDRFLITLGVDVNFNLKGSKNKPGLVLSDGIEDYVHYEEGNTAGNQERLLNLAAGRFWVESFFNFRLGVSYLL